MSSSSTTTSSSGGGPHPSPSPSPSPSVRILTSSLDKIIKNASWRKNSSLVSSCKSSLDLLSKDSPDGESPSNILGISSSAASSSLSSIQLALDPATSPSSKLLEPALDCVRQLILSSLVSGDVTSLLDSVSSLSSSDDTSTDLLLLKTLISFLKSPKSISFSSDSLVNLVKSCYNVYLGSPSPLAQLAAKASLAQIVSLVVSRVDAVSFRVVSVADVLDVSDRSLNDASVIQAAQTFVDEAMEGFGGVEEEEEGEGLSKGLFLFKNLCKFSMKFAAQENGEDQMLLRGKVLSLELLKMVVENAGAVWRTDERSVFLESVFHEVC